MTPAEKTKLQKDILDALPEQPTGRLLLAPRSGKTKLIIDLVKRDKPLNILWVTPSSQLATIDIPNEFIHWGAERFKQRLQTVTWKSLDTIEGEYDLIVFDEDQFITPVNCQNLLNGKLKGNTIISMTGTATKDKVKLDLYKLLGLEVLYELSISSAVDIGLLANYSMTVIKVPLGQDLNVQAGNAKKRFMTSELKQYAYLTNAVEIAKIKNAKNLHFRILNRMRAIKNSPTKLKVAKELISTLEGRKLIFSATIEQSKKLSPYFFNSKTTDKDLLAFKEGKVDSLALVNSGGTGFTYKAIDHLIVVQADSDNNGLTSQKICRTLLDQPDYKAKIWMICLEGTQDEVWVNKTLERFDHSKIEFYEYKDFKEKLYGNQPINT